jgi:hypothetical protein
MLEPCFLVGGLGVLFGSNGGGDSPGSVAASPLIEGGMGQGLERQAFQMVVICSMVAASRRRSLWAMFCFICSALVAPTMALETPG